LLPSPPAGYSAPVRSPHPDRGLPPFRLAGGQRPLGARASDVQGNLRGSDGLDAPALVARLHSHGWRGAVVGPHGSGKSTLLAALLPHLTAAECRPRLIALHDGQRRLPPTFLATCPAESEIDLAIIDGYEQLAYRERARLWFWSRQARRGLL